MLTNRAEMSTLYIGTYIDASYQVLVHLATVSEEKIFPQAIFVSDWLIFFKNILL
jgi:hypothetical protein